MPFFDLRLEIRKIAKLNIVAKLKYSSQSAAETKQIKNDGACVRHFLPFLCCIMYYLQSLVVEVRLLEADLLDLAFDEQFFAEVFLLLVLLLAILISPP